MGSYLEVAVPTPLRQVFHYQLPASLQHVEPGMRVQIEFGRRKLVGIAMSRSSQLPQGVRPEQTKPVLACLDQQPVWPSALFDMLRWAADYYLHPVGEVMATALPVLLRQGEQLSELSEELVAATPCDDTVLNRAPQQKALYQALLQAPMSRTEIKAAGYTQQIVKSLLQKQLVCWQQQQQDELAWDPASLKVHYPEGLMLTEEQNQALNQISQHASDCHLLFGITGSGKTEVYLRAIEAVLKEGRQALVLVPEIGLTPQTIARFRGRFDAPLEVLHSGLTDKERLAAWRRARSGSAAIIIGTRSALFTPLLNPGIIIVDEEHDASFKQQDGFRYSARDLAVLRGALENMPVLLGSATPSLESLHNAKTGRYHLSMLRHRPAEASSPGMQLLDVRDRPLEEGFAPALLDQIKANLHAGNQTLVFINRRGFAPVLFCGQCSWSASCRRCDARMTYHRSRGRLICHHCGSESPVPSQCGDCGSDDIMGMGAGTERIEAFLQQQFFGYPVFRIDRDTTRGKTAMADFLDTIGQGEPALLVGTQMLAKGHHFPDVTLVVMLDMDGGFFSTDFRAIEKTAQMVLQVAGRSGRADKPGQVVLQTRISNNPYFQHLMRGNYEKFADQLLSERQQYNLPPYSYQSLIRAESVQQQDPQQFLASIRQQLSSTQLGDIFGPVPAIMERRAGRFRAQLLLTAPTRGQLHNLAAQAVSIASNHSAARRVRWSIDVDPVDLY